MTENGRTFHKRRIYFIKRDFQFRFILKFCLVVLAGVVLSTGALFFFSSDSLTSTFEGSRLTIKNTAWAILPIVLYSNLLTLGLITLAAIAITLFVSHKLVGPLYRFEMDLEEIGRGNLVKQIRLRKGDQLIDFIQSINNMTNNLHSRVSHIQAGVVQVIKCASKENVPREIIQELDLLHKRIEESFKL